MRRLPCPRQWATVPPTFSSPPRRAAPARAPPFASTSADRLEFLHLFRQRPLDRQPLHRGCAIEAVAGLGILHDEIGVGGLGDPPPLREHEDIRAHPPRRPRPRVPQLRAIRSP